MNQDIKKISRFMWLSLGNYIFLSCLLHEDISLKLIYCTILFSCLLNLTDVFVFMPKESVKAWFKDAITIDSEKKVKNLLYFLATIGVLVWNTYFVFFR